MVMPDAAKADTLALNTPRQDGTAMDGGLRQFSAR